MKVNGSYKINNSTEETELITDSEGTIKITGLPIGKYSLVEVKAPEGYIINGNGVYEFEIDTSKYEEKDGELVNIPTLIEVPNDRIQVSIRKVDEEQHDLPGATLQLLNEDGTPIEEWETENKEHLCKPIGKGVYTLRETKAPDGYSIAEDMQIEVEEKTEKQEFVMIDKIAKATLEIIKIDSKEPTNKLADAEFEIVKVNKGENGVFEEDPEFEKIIRITDGDGKISIENLLYGTYKIKEIKAPEGYNLKKDDIIVEINAEKVDENNVVKVAIENIATTKIPITGNMSAGLTIIGGIILVTIGLLKRKRVLVKKRKKARIQKIHKY